MLSPLSGEQCIDAVVKVLIDHNLPPKLARALHVLLEPDHQVQALREKFGRSNLKDEEWIRALSGEGGWAVVSADMRIAKQRVSRELFVGAGLVGFFLSPAMQKWQLTRQCARMLMIWPQMVTLQKTVQRGVFEIPAKGSKFSQIGR